jgi:hypothetical protein
MSARSRSVAARRVVDRPRARACSTSAAFAAAIGAQQVSSARRPANSSKNREMAASGTAAMR